jgi:beta-lactamase class A
MSQISPIASPAADSVGSSTPPAPPSAPAAPTQSPATAATPEANQRLVIQESGEVGVFVYTILDRATGRVIVQLPRESVAEMARLSTYAAGQVITTTV